MNRKLSDPKNTQISSSFRWPAWNQIDFRDRKTKMLLTCPCFCCYSRTGPKNAVENKQERRFDFSHRFSQVNKLATEQSQKKLK